MEQALLRLGAYWPSMRQDAYTFVHTRARCQIKKPIPYGALYQVMVAPHLHQYIINYC